MTDDSGQALDLPPNRCGSSYRGDFGGQHHVAFDLTGPFTSDLTGRKKAPFARASEANRNCSPGYSWPPHLYQEKKSVMEWEGKDERKFDWAAFEKVLQLEGLQRFVLGGEKEFALERAVAGAAVQRFLGGDFSGIRVVVFL
jgi:hypothetical protein